MQNGASFTSGKVGEGFSLDGTDDFVLVSPNDDLNITGDVTVDLWAQRTTFVGTPMMVSKGAGATAGDPPTVYALRFVNAVLGCSTCNNSLNAVFERANGSNVNLFGPTVTDTNFHHYAYVRSNNTHKLFIDGAVVKSAAFSGSAADTSGLPLVIGGSRADADSFIQHFGGIIDGVQVFNRPLSDAEVKLNYESSVN